MQSLKLFSCQYEAFAVLFNLLYGDLIRKGQSHLLTGAVVFSKAEQGDKNEIKFPGLPQIWCLVCLLGCWLLLFGLGWFGARLVTLCRTPVLGCWVPFSGWREHPWHLLELGFSCALTCLVGVQFHLEHSLHHLNALKVLCDLMWGFLWQFSFMWKAGVTKDGTQKYPLLLKISGLLSM